MGMVARIPQTADPSLREAMRKLYEDLNRMPGRFLGAFASTDLPSTSDPALYYCKVWVTDEVCPAWLDPSGPTWRRGFITGAALNGTLGATTPASAVVTTLSITQGAVISGTYTPTATIVANLDAFSASAAIYMRVGAVVNVSGYVTVDPTLAATSTQGGLSLPIASNIGALEDVAGSAYASGIAAQGAAILGDAANDRAQIQWVSGDVTSQRMYYSYQYRII